MERVTITAREAASRRGRHASQRRWRRESRSHEYGRHMELMEVGQARERKKRKIPEWAGRERKREEASDKECVVMARSRKSMGNERDEKFEIKRQGCYPATAHGDHFHRIYILSCPIFLHNNAFRLPALRTRLPHRRVSFQPRSSFSRNDKHLPGSHCPASPLS